MSEHLEKGQRVWLLEPTMDGAVIQDAQGIIHCVRKAWEGASSFEWLYVVHFRVEGGVDMYLPFRDHEIKPVPAGKEVQIKPQLH